MQGMFIFVGFFVALSDLVLFIILAAMAYGQHLGRQERLIAKNQESKNVDRDA